jgi:hypothetical protein
MENALLPESLETIAQRWASLFRMPSFGPSPSFSGTFPDLPVPQEVQWELENGMRRT